MGSFAIPESFERVLVALLVGFLIGLDRERAEVRKKRREFAGVRTFPLIALIGELSVELLDVTGPLLAAMSFAAVGGVALMSYRRSTAEGAPGATTEIAALATFLLGAVAGTGQLLFAGALGIGVAVLLVAKPRLERFSRALSQDEISAALELAVTSGIILPLLPNRGLGPWDVWNPFDIWLVVVLVSGVSFAGFVAMRLFGTRRGLALAGLIGGMVSSTAVTAAMARRARDEPRLDRPAAGATVLASVVMCARVALFAGTFGRGILPRLLPVTFAMATVGLLAAWWVQRDAPSRGSGSETHMPNPSSLFAAVSFALLYGMILIVVRAAREYLGPSGMYVAAALSAVADVDAVTIAFASGGPVADAWRTPAAAVSLALVTNTLFKLGLAVGMGPPRFRRRVATGLAGMALAGAGAAVLIFFSFPLSTSVKNESDALWRGPRPGGKGDAMQEKRDVLVILMVDDDEEDRMLTKEALVESQVPGDLRFASDGEELLDYLRRQGRYGPPHDPPRPGLILLDLNMPRKDGREALREIKADPALRAIPVIVLSTSRAPEDIERCYQLGANSFITKPATFASLVQAMHALGHYWADVVQLPTGA